MADSNTESERIPYQPLHPSIIEELEKAYVKWHNTHVKYQKLETVWNPSWRTAPSRFASTSSRPVKVGDPRRIKLGKFEIWIYTPDGVQPAAGWPATLWLHGGMGFPVVAL